MRLPTSFDPIEVGEIDTFAFDFTSDLGDALIINGSFTCSLAAFQNNIADANPANHVFSTQILTQIALRVPPGGQLAIRNGNFVVASIGGFTSNANGATYVLSASASLSDGRVLDLSATVKIVQTQ